MYLRRSEGLRPKLGTVPVHVDNLLFGMKCYCLVAIVTADAACPSYSAID